MDKKQLLVELQQQGIRDQEVLRAMVQVPRTAFVPKDLKAAAHENAPLPIGFQQTISQPYVVARMKELLLEAAAGRERVLEVGTGSGYQAAILAQVFQHVFTIERIEPLLETAKQRFAQLALSNIETLYGDGYQGWPEQAPYDAIMVTAAAPEPPQALLDQLADQGVLVIPIGPCGQTQQLQVITRRGDDYHTEVYDHVVFVPMLAGKD